MTATLERNTFYARNYEWLNAMTEHADTQDKEWKSDSVRFFFPCSHSCPTLWDPMDCSLPSSFVHRIFQARILKLPFPTLGNLSDPGIKPVSPMSPALRADSLLCTAVIPVGCLEEGE